MIFLCAISYHFVQIFSIMSIPTCYFPGCPEPYDPSYADGIILGEIVRRYLWLVG